MMQQAIDQITVPCSSAAEFLDYVRPSKPHWRGKVRGKLRWIFRGQRDATWKLTPAAWRMDERSRREFELLSSFRGDRLSDFRFGLDRCRLIVPAEVARANEQTEAELRILNEFVAHVNIAGLNFPHETLRLNFCRMGFMAVASHYEMNDEEPSFEIRRSPFFDRVLERFKSEMPDSLPEDLSREAKGFSAVLSKGWPCFTNFTLNHPLVALAQHHGMPTRLVDWSHDSRKAAFFACRGLALPDLQDQGKRIAVIGLNPFMLQNRFVSDDALQDKIDDDLSVEVFLSRHEVYAEKNQTTSFLAAQEGLFTHACYPDLHFLFTGCYPDILRSLLKMHEWESRYAAQPDFFPLSDYVRKVTLPYTEVDSLLELLDDERVMLTTLMPSLDRMKDSMLERSARKKRLGI